MNWVHLVKLIKNDEVLFGALQAAQGMGLTNWVISGGAIRDLVWSDICGVSKIHKDLDLIYMDSQNLEKDKDTEIERKLNETFPHSWNVKNQARFAPRRNVANFSEIHEAMSFAPSTVSAVGVSQVPDGRITAFSVYGFQDLFEMRICPTPRYMENYTAEDFRVFVKRKGWIEKWPSAKLIIGGRALSDEL